MNYRIILIFAVLFAALSCAKKPTAHNWNDIDYSKVHNRQARENDSLYVAPSIASCVDDDLYNCR